MTGIYKTKQKNIKAFKLAPSHIFQTLLTDYFSPKHTLITLLLRHQPSVALSLPDRIYNSEKAISVYIKKNTVLY